MLQLAGSGMSLQKESLLEGKNQPRLGVSDLSGVGVQGLWTRRSSSARVFKQFAPSSETI